MTISEDFMEEARAILTGDDTWEDVIERMGAYIRLKEPDEGSKFEEMDLDRHEASGIAETFIEFWHYVADVNVLMELPDDECTEFIVERGRRIEDRLRMRIAALRAENDQHRRDSGR